VIVFWDESGASLLPVARRTWAPQGQTPVIRHRFKWKRASMAAALCYGSRGGGAAVAFHHQVGAYDTTTLIGALGQLRRFLGGQCRAVSSPQRSPVSTAASTSAR
jgi:DDE superfamily endonuclease